MNVAKLIALRTINTYKYVSPITCLGIKCLLNEFNDDNIDTLLPKILDRKIQVNKSFDKRRYKIYKEGLEDKTYRSMYVPSPTNALIESSLIYKFSLNESQDSESVYSYQLPKNTINSSGNFQPYFKNYTQMNENISERISKLSTNGVLVIDIRSFYPSIDKNEAVDIFNKRYGKIELLSDAVNSEEGGLAVGLDLSHIVAQEYMREFDDVMTTKYGGSYFRYVDDIYIPCNEDDNLSIVNFIQQNLTNGLVINKDKLDFITSSDWSYLVSQTSVKKKNSNFFEVVNLYISNNLDDLDVIENELRNSGIYLPINRIKNEVKTTRFRDFFNWLQSKDVFRIHPLSWTIEIFYNFLINRKEHHSQKLKKSIDDYKHTYASKEVRARICIQNIRFHLSNLLYLLDDVELLELAESLPKHEGLFAHQSIIKTLLDGDFKDLVTLNSKNVMTLSELWLARSKELIEFSFEGQNYSDFIENIAYLKLIRVIDFDLQDAKRHLDKESFDFLVAIFDKKNKNEQLTGYPKELNSLLFKYSEQQMHDFLTTPLDASQEINFSLEGYSPY
ncbi:RNA-directed DNA polymerase [Aliivibrio fischeri]|uniref:RNA-directed DNA polymerase n=1 Tax=Aliivibrio fischeri TaxID=668 RepID=UPI0012DA6AD9|nr:RNA-directed DNA polymerase [Aliivibrio fischeri]MUK64379.1 hypothetical protein [Aliivibrio fischeri]